MELCQNGVDMIFTLLLAGALASAEPSLSDITYPSSDGKPVKAYLVRPGQPIERAPAILFVHWLEPSSPDSNRTQYLAQAFDLARDGVVSLLPETLWSDPEWFNRRDPSQDYDASIRQAADLSKALDYLLSQPGVDPSRLAYVGHDFGMMYGLLLSKTDKRPRAWALQAGTSAFEDWFLYGRARLPEEEKQKVRDRLQPLAPLRFIGNLGVPVLLQFGTTDFHVPRARAEALANAAVSPKRILYYEGGHGLNDAAVRDRSAWLRQTLGIKSAVKD